MTHDSDTASQHIAASYRYLRLSVVVVVATLGASLAFERFGNDCQLGSISAYYYTPVHAVFIGSLITMGVVMIALKGRDGLEDILFNVAGILAPAVALVPTRPPGNLCDPHVVSVNSNELISNNVPALFVGSVFAIGLALVIAWKQQKLQVAVSRSAIVGLMISTLLLLSGVIWYFVACNEFRRWAHGATAIAMFVFIWIAVVVNAGWPRRLLIWIYRKLQEPLPAALGPHPTNRHLRYRRWYRALSIVMPAAGLAVVVFVDKSDKVFWLEVVEIIPFAGFWLLQTMEAWETGDTSTAPAE